MIKDFLIVDNNKLFNDISSSNQKDITDKKTRMSIKSIDAISMDLMSKKDSIYVVNKIYIDYIIYKKKLIKNIIFDINLFNDFFDDEISEILINIYILRKKNKINDLDFIIFKPIYDFVEMLIKLDKVDQEDFLPLTINFFKINILVDRMKNFFDNYIFKDLINFELFIGKIYQLNTVITQKNFFLKKFYELVEIKNDEDFKKKISEIAHILSIDFFMYYNSDNIFNKIINCIIVDKPNLIIFKNKYNFQKIVKKIIKHKEVFTSEYNKHVKLYKEVYISFDLESKIKYVLKKNIQVSKLIQDLNYIKDI